MNNWVGSLDSTADQDDPSPSAGPSDGPKKSPGHLPGHLGYLILDSVSSESKDILPSLSKQRWHRSQSEPAAKMSTPNKRPSFQNNLDNKLSVKRKPGDCEEAHFCKRVCGGVAEPMAAQQFGRITCSPSSALTPRFSYGTKPPEGLSTWLTMFHQWSGPDKNAALDSLINLCDPPQVKHMVSIIEPKFQRDFISLLPKELSLYVLSFLSPEDLGRAALTCRCWRILAEDNLLWREKCWEENVESSLRDNGNSLFDDLTTLNAPFCWKKAFVAQRTIEANWSQGKIRQRKTLKGHDDHVITCLEFSGNRIVSGSDDNILKVWDVESGKCLRTLVGHTGGVWSSQMKDNIVVSGSTDRSLKVWNIETGECIYTLHGHFSTVRCMKLHKDKVVSGSRDTTLRLWDIAEGRCLHQFTGHQAAVRCVQYDGKKVVSGAYDCTVRVWDPESVRCLFVLAGHTNRVYSLQFDGKHIVSGSLDTSIRVWDVDTGASLQTLIGHGSLTSGMELRENTLVSGNADSTVKIWDITSGQCLQTLQGPNRHRSAVTCLQLNRKFIISSSDDGTVKLWCLKTGEFVRNIVSLETAGRGGVVWQIKADNSRLVYAVGSRTGTEETKLMVLDFSPDLDSYFEDDGQLSDSSTDGDLAESYEFNPL